MLSDSLCFGIERVKLSYNPVIQSNRLVYIRQKRKICQHHHFLNVLLRFTAKVHNSDSFVLYTLNNRPFFSRISGKPL